MPGVIGLIDGTHILIKKPAIDVEHVYYAVRKSAHSKNVQVVIINKLNNLNKEYLLLGT